jgi:16S rRNA (uracil1498-N3)-methyltransferase
MNEALRRAAAHVFVDDIFAPAIAGDDRHHLTRVLRLRDGEVVTCSDGRGRWRTTRVVGGGELRVDGEVREEVAPCPVITLGVAVPKADRPEWIVQKLSEVGVDRVVFLSSARSVVRWDADRALRQLDRLRSVARLAAMQSRRVWLPEIEGVVEVGVAIRDAMSSLSGGGVALAEPGGGELDLGTPTVLVGPEGGWTREELDSAPATVSLGRTILRVETSALSAAIRLVAARDDAHNTM